MVLCGELCLHLSPTEWLLWELCCICWVTLTLWLPLRAHNGITGAVLICNTKLRFLGDNSRVNVSVLFRMW